MKSLKDWLKEDCGIGGATFATPANTTGMGDPMAPSPDNTQVGSGDIPTPVCIDVKTGKLYKKRKKFRRYKI